MKKTVFITGASRGIGKALAEKYAEENYELFLTARNEDLLSDLSGKLEKEYKVKAHYKVCDVAVKEEVDSAISEAFQKMGKIDIAILNAGIGIGNTFDDFKAETTIKMFEVNLFGVLYAMENLLPKMKNAGEGTIATVSSLADARGIPQSSGYNSSKRALTMISEAARMSMKKDNIHIATVRPGFIATDMTKQNDFKMPFLMDAKKAANIIFKGINKKKSYIDFPWQLSAVSWLFTRLPNGLYEMILKVK